MVVDVGGLWVAYVVTSYTGVLQAIRNHLEEKVGGAVQNRFFRARVTAQGVSVDIWPSYLG